MKNSFIWTLIIMNLCIVVSAEEQQDKLEFRLFQDLKAEYKLTDAQTYELLGRTYLHQDKWEKAVIFFDKAVQLNPKLYLSWYNLGLINMDNSEFFFKKAIEANSKFAPSYYWLALYYHKHGRAAESVEHFEGYLKVVDKNEPIEKDRIKAAGNFIKEIKAENTSHNITKGEVGGVSPEKAFNIFVEHLYNCSNALWKVGYSE